MISMWAATIFRILKKKPKTKIGKEGFTLVELMIVIAILGILLAIGIPNFMKFKEARRIKQGVQQQIEKQNKAPQGPVRSIGR